MIVQIETIFLVFFLIIELMCINLYMYWFFCPFLSGVALVVC